MNQWEITIASINGLRNLIVQYRIVAMNNHWNTAAFGNEPLNCKMICQVFRAVKDCSPRIHNICQTQAPWTPVKSKKCLRGHKHQYSPTKMTKIEAIS